MEPPVEIDPRLQAFSDTEIVLNFTCAMDALYPNLKAVYAHCYDPDDDVVEPQFYGMVYSSFSGKYGVPVPPQQCQTYDPVGNNYRQISYIRVRPCYLPIHGRWNDKPFELTEESVKGKALIFKAFGDGVHSLTGGEIESDPYDVRFNMTEIEVVDFVNSAKLSHQIFTVWVPNEAVDFEFVQNSKSLQLSNKGMHGIGKQPCLSASRPKLLRRQPVIHQVIFLPTKKNENHFYIPPENPLHHL